MLFENFNNDSRVWVYQADRFLTNTEVNWLNEQVESFVKEWAAHGNQLKAEGQVLHNRFVVLVVNESIHQASGCSIDSSVKFIKSVGNELEVDFFNRLQIVTKDGENFIDVQFADLSDYPGREYFNPMIQSLGELRDNWIIKVQEA